eukprot:409075_1
MYDHTEFALYAMNTTYRHQYNIERISIPKLSLPTLHTTSLMQAIVFSDIYGLLAIGDGGPYTFVHNLPFKWNIGYTFSEWKWNKFCPVGFSKKQKHLRRDASCLLFNSSTGNEKLFICGGRKRYFMYSVILDLETKKWITLPNLPHYMKRGVCYNFLNNTMYIIGTDYSSRSSIGRASVVYCDLYKPNGWRRFPQPLSTQFDNALMWIDGNILYVSSTSMNRIECIDLRKNKKQNNWKRIVKSIDKHEPLYLSKMFDVAIKVRKPNDYKLFR